MAMPKRPKKQVQTAPPVPPAPPLTSIRSVLLHLAAKDDLDAVLADKDPRWITELFVEPKPPKGTPIAGVLEFLVELVRGLVTLKELLAKAVEQGDAPRVRQQVEWWKLPAVGAQLSPQEAIALLALRRKVLLNDRGDESWALEDFLSEEEWESLVDGGAERAEGMGEIPEMDRLEAEIAERQRKLDALRAQSRTVVS